MCEWTQREYSCGHFRFIAARWCMDYTTTHKRCPPEITHCEWVRDLCGDCKSKEQPPVAWEYMIKRQTKRAVASF
ncbi:hypothetical protein C8A03DRAFT_15595 [Achaetomium macrosporum]|uniref:Uncharacterized protein n=1 Tax=Achaetomium macrosporum TaxID=79813 RepID=A0AAN7C9G6_9PEZI|nr:hypothetical protein C8A03DRAFT_15595 [Achaetomium macrosporum]